MSIYSQYNMNNYTLMFENIQNKTFMFQRVTYGPPSLKNYSRTLAFVTGYLDHMNNQSCHILRNASNSKCFATMNYVKKAKTHLKQHSQCANNTGCSSITRCDKCAMHTASDGQEHFIDSFLSDEKVQRTHVSVEPS